jgi:hypothetical protein
MKDYTAPLEKLRGARQRSHAITGDRPLHADELSISSADSDAGACDAERGSDATNRSLTANATPLYSTTLLWTRTLSRKRIGASDSENVVGAKRRQ